MNFNFSKVKDSSNAKKFVGYGINDDVTIVSVESGSTDKGVDYLDIKFKNTGDDDENSTRLREFFSEKGAEYSMKKIMAINNAVTKEELLKSKDFSDVSDMATQLDAMWKGRRLRLKLAAEEYDGVDADGKPKIKTRVKLPLFSFTEAIMPGAEHEPVGKDVTKLEFDRAISYDYKELVSSSNANSAPKDTGDGLPF